MSLKVPNKMLILILSIIGLFLFLILNISTGPANLAFGQILSFNLNDAGRLIFYEIRLPKAITAILAGCALSLSGLQMQTMFKNPLAGPYILGISSGAGLGVALLIMASALIPAFGILANDAWGIIIASCLGAGVFMTILFFMALRIKQIMTLLIFGIMMGSLISALIALMQYFSDANSLKTYVVWTMGSLGNTHWQHLKIMSLFVLAGGVISFILPKALNQLLLGEEYAQSLGQNLIRNRFLILTSTSLLTGAVTAFCGPISFIGLAVPHLVKMLLRTQDHLWLIPITAITGSTFLLACDWVCHWSTWGVQLPINAITALLGAPFVIFLILKNKGWSQ